MSSRDVSAIDHSIAATLSLEASSIVLSAPPAGVAQAILACSRVALPASRFGGEKLRNLYKFSHFLQKIGFK